MSKHIREVMTPGPETIQADRPVAEAAKLMKETDAGMIPVMDDSNLLGTVTDRDIALRIVAEGKDPQSTPVREIASTDIVTIEPDRDLDEALQLMAKHQVRRLPVVEDGRLVGVLSRAVLQRRLAEDEPPPLLEEA
jgi:CBS domain-containing protein